MSLSDKLYNENRCHHEFGKIEDASFPDLSVIFLSAAIIVLALFIGYLVTRGFVNEVVKPPANASEITPAATTNATSPLDTQSTTQKKEEEVPTPATRANRLIAASIVIVLVCAAFGYRITLLRYRYPEYCRSLYPTPPQWWAIVIFNILPFSGACMAWLRALVDCILVRWDTHLPQRYWPAYPLLAGVGLVLSCCHFAVSYAVYSMMGRRKEITWRKKDEGKDIEMVVDVVEEERALMGGMRDDDEATMYSPRNSTEGKVDEQRVEV
jgi:hypothetical protein